MVEEGGWVEMSLVKLISDSSRYRSAQFRDSSTEMGGAKWMGILVKMLGGVGGLRLRGFGRLDEHRMFHSEVKLGIIFGIQLSQSGTNCLFFKSYQFSLHPHCCAQ